MHPFSFLVRLCATATLMWTAAAPSLQCTADSPRTARLLLERGDYLASRRIYERLVRRAPDGCAACYGLAMTYSAEAIHKTELGLAQPADWFPAIYQLTVASQVCDSLEVERSLAIMHYNLGATFRRSGDIHHALQRLEQALSCDSTLLKASNLLGALYHEQGDYDRAEQWYRHSLVLRPDYAAAHFNLGALAWARGDYAAAQQAFAQAVALDSQSVAFSQWLARAHSRLNR